MEAVAEIRPSHDPVSVDYRMGHVELKPPGADPAAVELCVQSDGSSSSDPRPAAQEALRKQSVDLTIEPLAVDDVFPIPSVRGTSPLAAPADGTGGPPGTTVEEVPDEGEPLTPISRTPPSQTGELLSTAVKTPTTSNCVPMALRTGTASVQTPTDAGSGGASQEAPVHSTPYQSGVYRAPGPQRRPSALDYLISVSPGATPRATLEAAYKRAGVGTSHVSGLSNASAPRAWDSHHGDFPNGMAVNTGPPFNWTSNHPGHHGAYPGPGYQRPQAFSEVYGSPPMAHSHVSFANVTMPPTASSMMQPAYGADKLPMSGYQLLAAKLVGGLGGAPVTPMYRRFEALHHRLLLYMQADLVDLEKELRALDTKDTVERGYGAVPASRQHERWTNSALAQQRTEILGQIGYKLCQYNKVLTSFAKTHRIPGPSLGEIHEYKTYLASSRLVADEEARFLDSPEDLVTLVREELPGAEELVGDLGGTTSVAPRLVDEVAVSPPRPSRTETASEAGDGGGSAKRRRPRGSDSLETPLSQLALAMFVAVLVPIVTFGIIPDFAGRITIVALVGAGVGTALTQSGLARLLHRGALDWVICIVAYGATMAVVAWVLG